ncbi:MAG: DUF167 domain-containing protein [Alphaproteobacteria bacterium]|nr:DUF167 domain-containing protein [Alphaproteobacteria bacterium]
MRVIVHLTPKTSQNKVEGWAEDVKGEKVLRVKVTAVPEDGKANDALIKLLGAFFKVPKSKISLIRGATSRIKHLEIL